MILNLGSFFNTAKRQALAEREREQQIYARWAEASRRAESAGAAAGSSSRSDDRWVVGSTENFEEDGVTFALTEADIVEGDEILENEPSSINGAPSWIRSSEVEEESGRHAGEYFGHGDHADRADEQDDRQIEFPFNSAAEAEPAKDEKEFSFRDLWRKKINDDVSTRAADTASSLPAAAEDEFEPSPFISESAAEPPKVNAESDKSADSLFEAAASDAKPIAPNALDSASAPDLRPEKKGQSFLRGLSAAVERTINSARDVLPQATRYGSSLAEWGAGTSEGWNRPNPSPAFASGLNSGNSANPPAAEPSAAFSRSTARPGRLSEDGMVDSRIRPLDSFKKEIPRNPVFTASMPAKAAVPYKGGAAGAGSNNPEAGGSALIGREPAKIANDGRVPPADMSIDVERDLRARFGGNIRSALGCGTVIEGKFTFDSPVRIDGALTGEVISNSLLIVGEHAIVRARIDVGSLIVLGEVAGEVTATDLVEIRSTGSLRGDLLAHRFAVEEGGFYQGNVNLTKASKKS